MEQPLLLYENRKKFLTQLYMSLAERKDLALLQLKCGFSTFQVIRMVESVNMESWHAINKPLIPPFLILARSAI